jgi:hypothetical protein
MEGKWRGSNSEVHGGGGRPRTQRQDPGQGLQYQAAVKFDSNSNLNQIQIRSNF